MKEIKRLKQLKQLFSDLDIKTLIMKLSWGHKIAATYLVFVAGMVFLVFKANSEKFDLVTKDYYGAELKYQEVIDQAANATALSSPVIVEKKGSELTIRFPSEMNAKKKEIDFYLYCPADEKKDFRKSLVVDEVEFKQVLPNGFSGLYELKLTWLTGGKKYYHEKKIFL
jgi:hypothetical protein